MISKNSIDFQFFKLLQNFYLENKSKITKTYKNATVKFLDYNDKKNNSNAFLHQPQFEAFEMYVFIKEFFNNQKIINIFKDWKASSGKFSQDNNKIVFEKNGQMSFYEMNEATYDDIFKEMEKYEEDYPNYIYALTMGLGKTILMATCIFYDFILASKYPDDQIYIHNALVFAPDTTVLQSLLEIKTFDKSLVVPNEFVKKLDNNLKFHFLDDTAVSLNTIDETDFNIIISNTQKIILKKKNKKPSAVDKLFNSSDIPEEIKNLLGEDVLKLEESDVTTNQRFEKLKRLKQLGIYVDEAHHLFGKELQNSLQKNKQITSLRNTINELSIALKKAGSMVVACYNYTGTPYVKNSILPDVVYYYGLEDAIDNEYLKNVITNSFTNVKDEAYIEEVIESFFKLQNNKTYEGLKPKLAIFASRVEEVENELLPLVSRILSKLNIDQNTILVNLGDSALTKDYEIKLFNDLDVAGSEGSQKQIILLVNKGREGWNCRSLFGVALFREPKSKIFVLQATMRCLRKITSQQQTAYVYMSDENYRILQEELENNFRVRIESLEPKNKTTKTVEIYPEEPMKKIKINRITQSYEIYIKNPIEKLNFDLDTLNLDKYVEKVSTKIGMHEKLSSNEVEVKLQKQLVFSKIMIISEIARYLNVSCVKIQTLLEESADGLDKIISYVNKYNQILFDFLIPFTYKYLFDVTTKTDFVIEEIPLLLSKHDNSPFIFNTAENLIAYKNEAIYRKLSNKSFHTNVYCFDSKPELDFFNEMLYREDVKEIYFTGMFTGVYNGLAVQYLDPETNSVRTYYPDFYIVYENGNEEIVEVKADFMIDDSNVNAKKLAAENLVKNSNLKYRLVKSSEVKSKSRIK
jgi:hypothetical protein